MLVRIAVTCYRHHHRSFSLFLSPAFPVSLISYDFGVLLSLSLSTQTSKKGELSFVSKVFSHSDTQKTNLEIKKKNTKQTAIDNY